jgi:hypothetical protein
MIVMEQDKKEIAIVPVSEGTLRNAIEKKKYIRMSFQNPKKADFMAFYVIRPVKAITHIAKILKMEGKGSLKIYYLGRIKKLNLPIIKNDRFLLQGFVYTTFEKFQKAKTLRDLF